MITIHDIINKLRNAGFLDIEYNEKYEVDATLPPFSKARPFQKETIRYYKVSSIVQKYPCSHDRSVTDPVIFDFEKCEVLKDA